MSKASMILIVRGVNPSHQARASVSSRLLVNGTEVAIGSEESCKLYALIVQRALRVADHHVTYAVERSAGAYRWAKLPYR